MVLAPPTTRASRVAVALRVFGWVLVSAGLVVALYLVYSLLFTTRETDAAQSAFADEWAAMVSGPDAADPRAGAPGAEPDRSPQPDRSPGPDEPAGEGESAGPEPGDGASAEDPTVGDAPGASGGEPGRAVAVLEFSRPGSSRRPVAAEALYVVGGVGLDDLRQGPGHYPRSAEPGEAGNFAVAGHRTTYGGPFFHLDDLRPGDEVHVTDRDGRRHTYRVRDQRVVSPADTWVVDPEPLGRDRPTLTLTTCHPRFSARERLVVWAELV